MTDRIDPLEVRYEAQGSAVYADGDLATVVFQARPDQLTVHMDHAVLAALGEQITRALRRRDTPTPHSTNS